MRVSIKSIGKDLGISHMTVSRALSGYPNVNAETRAAVAKRAAELGYVKSSAANAMRGMPTAIVGLLLPNIVNEFYARFANALGLLCADRGLDLVIHLTNDDTNREQLSLQRLQALQASAVIMVPTPAAASERFDLLPSMRVISLIRVRDADIAANTLLIDDGPSIAAAADHLVTSGCRRIAYIGGSDILSSGRARLAAFTQALGKRGLEPDPRLILTGPPSYDMGSSSVAALLDGTGSCDGLICGGFEISNGALDACLQRKVTFPTDLAFVGYGDPSAYRWIGGGITTISLSAVDMAERAIALLEEGDADVAAAGPLPTCLVIRQSA